MNQEGLIGTPPVLPLKEKAAHVLPVADLKQGMLSYTPVLDLEHKEAEIEVVWEHKVAEFEVDLVQKVTTTRTIKELMEKWILGYPPPTAKVQERSANSDMKCTMSNYISTQFNCKNPSLDFPKLNGENANGWVKKFNLFYMFNKFIVDPKFITMNPFAEDFDEGINGFKEFAGSRKNIKDFGVDKCKPHSWEELDVHKKKVEEVKMWFEERLITAKECEMFCWKNCSYMAYASLNMRNG